MLTRYKVFVEGLDWQTDWMEPPPALCISGENLGATQGCVMSDRAQNAWDKAASCEAHAQDSQDDRCRVMFRRLRDSWIRIANSAQFIEDVTRNGERLDQKG